MEQLVLSVEDCNLLRISLVDKALKANMAILNFKLNILQSLLALLMLSFEAFQEVFVKYSERLDNRLSSQSLDYT